jgi:hypothetical protein
VTAHTTSDSVAQLHIQARRDLAAGAAQRDPRAVKAADATARQHGADAAQAGGSRG